MSILYSHVHHSPVAPGPENHRKRSVPPSSEPFDEYPSKRVSSSNLYPSYWQEDNSPRTPESGIDMNCSPPCYTVPMAHVYEQPTEPLSKQLQPGQSKDGYLIVIVDEPEENYRARYDSEGCRGPMKGRNGGCPTVEIISKQYQWLSADVKVELVAADRTPLNTCKLDSTEDGDNLLKKAQPNERISFENLRVRRLKKGDTASGRGKAVSKQPLKGARSKQDEKVAYLLFTATIHTPYTTGQIQVKVQSQAIYLNASHDPPEIHCVVPQYATSGDILAIIGTRMHSPRVSFVAIVDGSEQEIPADINKEVSHQNALVVRVPNLPSGAYTSNVANIRIVVTAGKGDRSGREPLKSNSFSFVCVTTGMCKECIMTQQFSSAMYGGRQLSPSTPPKPPPIIRHTLSPPKPISPRPSSRTRSPGYASPTTTNTTMQQPVTSAYTFTKTNVCGPTPPIDHTSRSRSSPSDVVEDILSMYSPQTPPTCFTEPVVGGPVSPDEFNRYLPETRETFPPQPQQPDFPAIFGGGSPGMVGTSTSMVQPNSLGHFIKNL